MPDIDKEKTCCFFGHRKIDETEELKNNLRGIIEKLIVNEKVDTFFFGSKSQFDDLCHKIVTELKEKYPHLKRIYVRSAYQHIPDWYEKSLLENNEGTYFPEHTVRTTQKLFISKWRNRAPFVDFVNHEIFRKHPYINPKVKNPENRLNSGFQDFLCFSLALYVLKFQDVIETVFVYKLSNQLGY